ncbi:MAG: NYN domain-containing protein, partial [Streptosporangiaceae bacterium]
MDRCALFVDAGYALADGAMAVHGTRRQDSVSWDHAGLLKLLAGLARDRTGLPVLRCYWYETVADGARTVEHDALAEMPGLKLRLVDSRPGRREGIESQLRRDLLTLAKNGAISDAFVASSDEHVAEIVAEVQDLGIRVVILHISANDGWTIPQALRQECDDIVEISGVHLRPHVELIRGAEPTGSDEQYGREPAAAPRGAGEYAGAGLARAGAAGAGAFAPA